MIDGAQVRSQAQSGCVGEQLFAVVAKRKLPTEFTKSGKPKKDKWERYFRAPRPEDDNNASIEAALNERLPEWDALNLIPNEAIGLANPKWDPRLYGISTFRQFFSSRQLLAHGTSSEIFSTLLKEETVDSQGLSDLKRAAFGLLAIALDRLIDWNSRQCTWELGKQRMAHTFAVHAFPFKWSFAEMALLVSGQGYEWTFRQTGQCLNELINLLGSDGSAFATAGPLFNQESSTNSALAKSAGLVISCGSGDSLDHVASGSVEVIVMDPPYYDNVMYAELSDFFYVWLKRTAGLLYPELFMAPLTNKDDEAVLASQRLV